MGCSGYRFCPQCGKPIAHVLDELPADGRLLGLTDGEREALRVLRQYGPLTARDARRLLSWRHIGGQLDGLMKRGLIEKRRADPLATDSHRSYIYSAKDADESAVGARPRKYRAAHDISRQSAVDPTNGRLPR